MPLANGVGAQLLTWGSREQQLVRWLRLLQEMHPGAIMDVGVNIGMYTIISALADDSVPYIGFEPSAACAAFASRVIRENRLDRHTVLPIGLSDRAGTALFHQAGEYDVSATSIPNFRPASIEVQQIPVVFSRGDDVLTSIKESHQIFELSVIKIDVEGSELEVLRGLARTLRERRPTLILEVLPYNHILSENGKHFAGTDITDRRRNAESRRKRILQTDAELRDAGYVFYRICRDLTVQHLDYLDPGEFVDLEAVDHFCVPVERQVIFERAMGVSLSSANL